MNNSIRDRREFLLIFMNSLLLLTNLRACCILIIEWRATPCDPVLFYMFFFILRDFFSSNDNIIAREYIICEIREVTGCAIEIH